jgi:acetyl esterase/lipase
MDYSMNRKILDKVIKERQIIRNVSIHRKADGTMDIESNLKLWNTVISKFEQIQLWEDGSPNYNENVKLQPQPSMIFVPSPTAEIRGTVIVAHGGGFEIRTGCEGFHVADYFNRAGYAVAILTYRIKPYTRLDGMADMQRAIRVLRYKKEELKISDKIAVMGFSAGAMLAGNCATHFDCGDKSSDDIVERYSCRPDAAVIGYGAFSSVSFPGRMFEGLFDNPDRAEMVYLAPEKNITVETPPFFIWQTNSDDPRYSLNLAKELTDIGIPFELHCFPGGMHGLALADGNNDLDCKVPHVMHWSKLCDEWLQNLGF